ncbi:MAG: VCBS repeat-containing protein [Planctomycetes bacterium]|nr:VCBS repeat-containing protein [Planctomycetota bacterium]
MEFNGDGCIDILSGSYSRQDQDMAGLFQVLWGNKDGTFRKPEVLKGTDGEPLIIQVGDGDDAMIEKICTRPTLVDLNGDGKLDIVSGNFRGTFAFFAGEGDGKFAPKSTWLQLADKPLSVSMHSDPFFVDWDADGDLDLLSGTAEGGVFLFENVGSAKAPKFIPPQTLLAAAGHGDAGEDEKFGDAHLVGPQSGTRIWVADVNGDGKLDLLVGDQVTLHHLADGVDAATAKAQLAKWREKQKKLFESQAANQTDEQQEQFQKAYEALEEERTKLVRDEMTGFVWLLLQK